MKDNMGINDNPLEEANIMEYFRKEVALEMSFERGARSL